MDIIVYVGMFEHVGWKNYRIYMETVQRCIKDEGLFLLHTIGRNRTVEESDAWFDRYIFPIPSMKRISASVEDLIAVEDWHNFRRYYDPTLLS